MHLAFHENDKFSKEMDNDLFSYTQDINNWIAGHHQHYLFHIYDFVLVGIFSELIVICRKKMHAPPRSLSCSVAATHHHNGD